MKQPIRNQLLSPLLGVVVTAVAGVVGVSAVVSSARQVAMLEARRQEVMSTLEGAAFPLSRPVLRQLASLSGQEFVLWDPSQGRVLLTSFKRQPEELSALASRFSKSGRWPQSLALAGENYEVGAVRLRNQPGGEILVLTPGSSLRAARWGAVWPPLAVGAAALAGLVPFVLSIANGWSARVRSIQREVARIARGEEPGDFPRQQRDDELAALVNDIQQMSRTLAGLQQQLVQTERERLTAQLAAGFAHQFRNGVAGAALALQLHQARCSTPGDKGLQVASRQLALLETEIRGILWLGKAPRAAVDEIPLARLFEQAVELIQPVAEHHSIDLQRTALAEACVRASADGLRGALVNLLLNAIDAAGPGGAVRYGARVEHETIVSFVEDNGPGPPPQIADQLADAFVTSKPEGLGLGLTVVKHIADSMEGELRWKRHPPWTVFELRLPRAGSTQATIHE